MKKKGNTLTKVLLLVVHVFIGFCVGFFISKFLIDSGASLADILLRLLLAVVLFLFAFVLQIVLHEAGHMLAGLAAGWRFVSFRIFNVMLLRRDGRYRLTSFGIPGMAGQCLMSPPDLPAAQCRFMSYEAGGFIANAVITLVALAVLLWGGDRLGLGWTIFLFSLIVSGLVLVLSNGVPLEAGGIPNDGMTIRHLRRDPSLAEVLVNLLRCNAMQMDGVRLKDMPDDCFGAMTVADCSGYNGTMLAMMRMSREIDRHDFESAATLARELKAHEADIPGIYVMELTREYIFLKLLGYDAPCEVGQIRDKKMSAFLKAMSSCYLPVVRLLYASALLDEHDEAKAATLRARFDKLAARYFSPADAESERELMDIIDSRAAAVATDRQA